RSSGRLRGDSRRDARLGHSVRRRQGFPFRVRAAALNAATIREFTMDRSICRILRLAAWAFGAASLRFGSSAFAQSITLTDIAGRQVTLERPAQHVILGEGRQLNALALLHPDPVGLVAGWLGELQRF